MNILEYLDSVSIDVVKRKYYNANKVTAVFDELRNYGEELLSENAALRAELDALKAELAERDRTQQSTSQVMKALQQAYRETMEKAHTRAEELQLDAEKNGRAMMQAAEERSESAARQVEECLNAVREREEQNIDFLNATLQDLLSSLSDGSAKPDGRAKYQSSAKADRAAREKERQDALRAAEKSAWYSGAAYRQETAAGERTAGGSREGALPPERQQELRRRVSALSEEIDALEAHRE